jgi:L-threonylcarbamoyladenylate synthase
LKSHYAPHTALYRGNIDELLLKWEGKNVAVISFSKFYEGVKPEWSFVLAPSGDLNIAAAQLFGVLRKIDAIDGIDVVLAEFFPDEGLGKAINDRLDRACAQWK